MVVRNHILELLVRGIVLRTFWFVYLSIIVELLTKAGKKAEFLGLRLLQLGNKEYSLDLPL